MQQELPRIALQRDWVWRGWQIRYTYLRSGLSSEATSAPLILLHGFGASVGHWRKNLSALSENHTVYALDLLGFGASRKVSTRYKISLWVDQVYDFWQTFIGEPVVLVGNSIGSLICLVAAASYPEMVKGLVMLSLPDVSLRQEMIPQFLQPLVRTIENLVASPLLLKPLFYLIRRREIIRRWVAIAYADKQAVTEELVELIATPPQDEGAVAAFCALCQAVNQPDFAPAVKQILPQLQVPILLIWGLQDRMIPPSLAPSFAALNPQIQLVELDNAGHCPHDECPERFNDLVSSWLNNLGDNLVVDT